MFGTSIWSNFSHYQNFKEYLWSKQMFKGNPCLKIIDYVFISVYILLLVRQQTDYKVNICKKKIVYIVYIYFMKTWLVVTCSTISSRLSHIILLEKNMNKWIELNELESKYKTANLPPLWNKVTNCFILITRREPCFAHTFNDAHNNG